MKSLGTILLLSAFLVAGCGPSAPEGQDANAGAPDWTGLLWPDMAQKRWLR